jgi:hypothetical protein
VQDTVTSVLEQQTFVKAINRIIPGFGEAVMILHEIHISLFYKTPPTMKLLFQQIAATQKALKRLCLLLFTLMLISGSCKKKPDPCEEPKNVNNSEVIIIFKNQAEDYLYKEINSPYNKDSLKVFDENGNQLILISLARQISNSSFAYYAISFGNIYDSATDQSSFDSKRCKYFIIKYSYNETDTVQTCFKSVKTPCGSMFETLKVYHKDQLLDSVSNNTGAHITLIKP